MRKLLQSGRTVTITVLTFTKIQDFFKFWQSFEVVFGFYFAGWGGEIL
jgi:hypothetical protein